MDVGEFIKVLEYYNTKTLTDAGDTYRACCPLHQGNNPTSFVLNKNNGLWYCHAGCGGGDIITFVEKIEDTNFEGALNKISYILEMDVNDIKTKAQLSFIQKNTEKWIRFVQKNYKENLDDYEMPDTKLYTIKSYREFDEDTIMFFGAKYSKEFPIQKRDGSRSILYNRIVFPLYFKNRLVGVSLRRVDNKSSPKWLHQPTKINTGELLYNYDNIKPFEPIGIVEGILDVWKYYKIGITNVVATFGANLTKEQENLLIKKTDSIWLSYDNDSAGNRATNEVIDRMKYKTNIKVIKLPINKDPEDVNDVRLKELYNNMERVI